MTSQSPFRVNKAASASETAVKGLVLIRRNDGIVLPEDYQTELLRDAIMSTSFNSFATTGLVAALSLAAVSVDAMACSRILSNTNGQATVVARTMDLNRPDHAQIAVFPRGMSRLSDTGDGKPLKWTSKYGSVGVVTGGKSTPDGMNEKGLVANTLYLTDTEYEPADDRPGLSNLIWAQYVLDNFSTVNEALKGLESVRIVSEALGGTDWPMHLSISDSEGDSAVIEYVDGKKVVHHGKEFTVMTNEPPLEIQLGNLKNYEAFGGTKSLPGDIDPESRFVRASAFLKTLPPADSVQQAIADAQALGRSVAVPRGALDTSGSEAVDAWPTLWFTLADSTNKTYIFHSAASPNVYWVDLEEIDFDAADRQKTLDAYDTSLVGDITEKLMRAD